MFLRFHILGNAAIIVNRRYSTARVAVRPMALTQITEKTLSLNSPLSLINPLDTDCTKSSTVLEKTSSRPRPDPSNGVMSKFQCRLILGWCSGGGGGGCVQGGGAEGVQDGLRGLGLGGRGGVEGRCRCGGVPGEGGRELLRVEASEGDIRWGGGV